MNSRSFFEKKQAAVFFAVALLALPATVGLAAPSQGKIAPPPVPDLFLDAKAPANVQEPDPVLIHHAATVNFEALSNAKQQGASLRFNLFPDAIFTGVVESVETRADTDYTLTGRLQGEEFSSFALVVNQGVLIMNLRPGNGGLFEVRYLGNGVQDVRKIDEKLFPTCETGAAQAVKPQNRPAAVRPRGGPAADAGDTIDVMVVYTPAARVAAGGTAAMQALINLAFTESNTAYQQSLITPRIRLVYQAEIAYTESGAFSTDLDRLTNPSDGYMDEVHGLRDTYGADLVSLWIDNSASCGIAWLMTSLSTSFEDEAFSVVHWDCATGYYSFSHEMGHNMGCAHDRENASGSGLYSYSYGWRFNGMDSVQYRTIMAYAPGARIQRFSNPNVSYQGVATGVAVGDPNESYNALTINNSAYTVANFRQTVVGTNLPPTITSHPNSQSVYAGTNVTFSVSANGTAPLSYQWQKNSSAIAGATLSSYTINNVQLTNAGTYLVVVTNAFGTATSSNAVLTVTIPISLAESLDALAQSWSSGGTAPWSGQAVTTHDGVDAAQSGTITNSQDSWFETTVTGPGTLTFWWKVSSESGFDFLRFYTNGVELVQLPSISGEVNWQQKSVNISAGSQTLRWRYQKDIIVSAGQDKAWVDQVIYTPLPTLAEALDNPGLTWLTGGNASWLPQTSVTHDGVDAAVSGTITDNQYSTLTASVVGPGTLSFWWKVSSEMDYDWLAFFTNGGYTGYSISGEIPWTPVSLSIPPGTNALYWQYSKDVSFSSGQDKAWVDQVVFAAPSLLISNSVARGMNAQFLFQFTGAFGASYTVQASTNLVDWLTLTNYTATSLPISVMDTDILSYKTRFFRVVSP